MRDGGGGVAGAAVSGNVGNDTVGKEVAGSVCAGDAGAVNARRKGGPAVPIRNGATGCGASWWGVGPAWVVVLMWRGVFGCRYLLFGPPGVGCFVVGGVLQRGFEGVFGAVSPTSHFGVFGAHNWRELGEVVPGSSPRRGLQGRWWGSLVCVFAKRCVLFFELPRSLGERKTPNRMPGLPVLGGLPRH